MDLLSYFQSHFSQVQLTLRAVTATVRSSPFEDTLPSPNILSTAGRKPVLVVSNTPSSHGIRKRASSQVERANKAKSKKRASFTIKVKRKSSVRSWKAQKSTFSQKLTSMNTVSPINSSQKTPKDKINVPKPSLFIPFCKLEEQTAFLHKSSQLSTSNN